jgi:NADPH:quinone reductase-like Zn-dependent oxidoreductase
MKELIFDQTGTPQEVLYLKESEMPQPKAHEVLIRVKARNIPFRHYVCAWDVRHHPQTPE